MTQTPGPGGVIEDSVRAHLPDPVLLAITKELAMLAPLKLLPSLLAALSSTAPGETPLEQATRAFEAGEFAQVLALGAAAKADSPDFPRLAYLAGEAQLVLGAPAEAEKAFRTVLAQRPKAVPAQIGLGRALMAQDKLDAAGAELEAALKAAPKDAGALTAHGLLLSVSEKSEQAKKELALALELEPKNALVVRGAVEVLLRADDVPGAAAVAEAFLKLRPEHPMGPFLMAWTLERDDEDELALEQYQAALAKDPNFIDAHKNLAILCHTLSNTYRDKERVKLAYAHYERYFALGGRDQDLKTMFENLVSFKEQILGM